MSNHSANWTRGSVSWACIAHLLFCFEETLYRTFHRCFLTSFGSFDQEDFFRNRPIKNKNCLLGPCLLKDRDIMCSRYREPFIDASYQVSVHLTKGVSEEKIFRNWPIRNKNCLQWSCLLTNRDEMSNLYRGPSVDASYQVWVHLVKWFQRKRFFRNRPMISKNCLWWPCLLADRDKLNTLYRGTSTDPSYQVSVHFAKQFQKRRF